MVERLNGPACDAIVSAQRHARRLGHSAIGTEHLLLALVHVARLDPQRTETAIVALRTVPVDRPATDLATCGVHLDAIRPAVEADCGEGASEAALNERCAVPTGHSLFSPRVVRVLELSLSESLRLKHNIITPEHLFLGILREGEGLAWQVMADLGVDFWQLRARVEAEIVVPSRWRRRFRIGAR